MRFHHLAITAFGPYGGTEVVDFDELNEAGVFLVTGPTGAGKTSILDAICFALYGVVPGEREVKGVRSQHAAPDVRPEVVLEASIAGRRFRIRRSPEWWRPKKRGEGQTRENASASLCEILDRGERLVSSRAAEVGHELTALLGMGAEQFMQVVMLPQGQFRTFLYASSDDRQTILQRLFQTQRFERIEGWMKHRSRGLASRAEVAKAEVDHLLGTIAHRSGCPIPAELTGRRGRELSEPATSWAAEALACAEAAHEAAVRQELAAVAAQEALERTQREAAVQMDALRRREAAEAALADLDQGTAEAAAEKDALDRHQRASLVRPLLEPLAAARRDAEIAADMEATALARLSAVPAGLRPATADRAGCEAARELVVDRLRTLEHLGPRERELANARRELTEVIGERTAVEEELEALRLRADDLPSVRDSTSQARDEARVAAAELPAVRRTLEKAERILEAATALPPALDHCASLVESLAATRERAHEARERHLDIVERRLAGMAAELAGSLRDGHPCQVCGSTVHPRLAQPSVEAVSERDQQRARAEADRLQAARDVLQTQVEHARQEVGRLDQIAGGRTADQAKAEVSSLTAAVALGESAAAALLGLDARMADLVAEEQVIARALQAKQEQAVRLEARSQTLDEFAAAVTAEVAVALGDLGGSVVEAIHACSRAEAALTRAVNAADDHARSALRWEQARRSADSEAVAQGFGSAAEAVGALLDPCRVDDLRAAARRREDARAAARAALAEPAVAAVAGSVPRDLRMLGSALDEARAAARTASALVGSTDERRATLAVLVAELGSALDQWTALHDELEVADRMSKLVRGVGVDNHLQMRLSSYVLATRLDQVLDAANERLGQMPDQRYTLRRSGSARGGTRAGLGMEVLDNWTGQLRAPTTLSGGETFVVSLALALGLADVVAHESGGLRLDTLFIDEGFGMLDPDTLEDVMDRVDALRAGGRTVGVVSHVTELRGRIPTQLHVTLGRHGSTVGVRSLVA